MIVISPEEYESFSKSLDLASKYLNNYRLQETASLVRGLSLRQFHITPNVETAKLAQSCINSFDMEWGKEPYRKKVEVSLQNGFGRKVSVNAAKDQDKWKAHLSSLISVFEARKDALTIINDIYRALDQTRNVSDKILLTSFFYLVTFEGDFDQSLRVLYLLLKEADEPLSFSHARSKSVKELKDEVSAIIGKENLETLFEGYSSNLRNSIAHANFRYDIQTKQITFEDYWPSTGEPSCEPITMSMNDLIWHHIDKLQSVSLYISFFFFRMLIMRIFLANLNSVQLKEFEGSLGLNLK